MPKHASKRTSEWAGVIASFSKDLRSEAIHLAESEPNLLDSLAALDFPERADWDELVQIYQLAAAPKLAVDQAQFLNEAYAQEDPLQDLLAHAPPSGDPAGTDQVPDRRNAQAGRPGFGEPDLER